MFYYSEGKTRISLFLNSFATVSVITLSLILQHYYGLMGFVLGIAISGVVTSMIGVILYCKNYKMKISEYLKNAYLQTYLCVLVMYLGTKIILNYVDAVNWFLFVGLCAISISIYIVCLFIIIPKKEMKRMINMVVPGRSQRSIWFLTLESGCTRLPLSVLHYLMLFSSGYPVGGCSSWDGFVLPTEHLL